MIAIARKNVFCSPSSFIYTTIVDFSTSRLRRVNPSRAIYDLLAVKHHFSPKLASFASLHFNRIRSAKRANSMISFLKENSFTTSQMEKMVLYNPRILGIDTEELRVKFKLFHDLGLSPDEIAKIMSSSPVILHLSTSNKIIPALSVLQRLLGSNSDVVRLLRKSVWFIASDLERILMPNLEMFKSFGIPMERILQRLYSHPRHFLLKPDIMRKAVDRAIAIGIPHNSTTFINAVCVFASTSEGMWQVKLQTLQDLGFSDKDVFTMFGKAPLAFNQSSKKMKSVIELLLATGKYNILSIARYPWAIAASIENRLEPRLGILGVLETRNLIKKWPGLSALSCFTDDKFFEKFVRRYYDEIGEEYITKIYFRDKTG